MHSTIFYHPVRDPGGKKAVEEIQPTWPVMLIPEYDSPEEWEAVAKVQQQKLLAESAAMMARIAARDDPIDGTDNGGGMPPKLS